MSDRACLLKDVAGCGALVLCGASRGNAPAWFVLPLRGVTFLLVVAAVTLAVTDAWRGRAKR